MPASSARPCWAGPSGPVYKELRTQRLLLRPVGPQDLKAVHAYASDPENTRYTMGLPNDTAAETAAFLAEAAAAWAQERTDWYEFAVTLDGAVIGTVSLELRGGEGHLGWILDKRYWHRGYALEAARAVGDFAFRELGLRRLIAQCDQRNEASWRLMEKLGMRLADASGTRTYRKRKETGVERTYVLDAPVSSDQ